MPLLKTDTFNFSAVFDGAYLMEVHDNDLNAIADIFMTAHEQISNEIRLTRPYADNGDADSLRQRFHRIKPLWGFSGLHYWQQHVQVFEDFCMRKPARENLTESYYRLINQMEIGLSLLQEEANRLKNHLH